MIDKIKFFVNNNKVYSSMVTNVIIRGLNLSSKFLFTLFLAKYFSADFLGSYTIFLTTVTVSIYFIGFEYYAYSQREYLSVDISNFASFVRNQFVFHSIGYMFLLPFVIIFSKSFIPTEYMIFFVIILILDHLNQEFYRLLVVLNKTVVATFNNFFRSGIWIFVFIYLCYFNTNLRTLNFIYLVWLIGELLCFVFSIYFFRGLGWRNARQEKINWHWIKNGIKVSSVFFVSGIVLKTIEYSERFFLQKIIDTKTVGVYFFFYNIAYLPYTFFTTVLIINYLPKIINTFKTDTKEAYLNTKKEFLVTTKYFVLVFYTLTIIAYFIIINYFLKDNIYVDNKNIFWGLLFASFITIISEIQYIELYIRHLDKLILKSFLLTVVIHIIVNYYLINIGGVFGAVFAKIIVVFILSISRLYIIRKHCLHDK